MPNWSLSGSDNQATHAGESQFRMMLNLLLLLTPPSVGDVRNGSSASNGTIHGEIEVAKFFDVKAVNSFCWKSRADQSFNKTNPKIWSSALSTSISFPSSSLFPMTAANSTSKSSFWQRPDTVLPLTRLWPFGRCTGVPETMTDDARPWYAAGASQKLGISCVISEPFFRKSADCTSDSVSLPDMLVGKYSCNSRSVRGRVR